MQKHSNRSPLQCSPSLRELYQKYRNRRSHDLVREWCVPGNPEWDACTAGQDRQGELRVRGFRLTHCRQIHASSWGVEAHVHRAEDILPGSSRTEPQTGPGGPGAIVGPRSHPRFGTTGSREQPSDGDRFGATEPEHRRVSWLFFLAPRRVPGTSLSSSMVDTWMFLGRCRVGVDKGVIESPDLVGENVIFLASSLDPTNKG